MSRREKGNNGNAGATSAAAPAGAVGDDEKIYKSILLHASITIVDASANIKENLLIQQSQQKHFTEEEEQQQQQTTTAQQVQLELETKPNKQR